MSDMQDLFLKDPLHLTQPDLDAMVAYYRSKLAAYDLGDKQAGATKKMKAATPQNKITDLSAILSEIYK